MPKWGRGRRARYVTPDLSYYCEGAREKCEDNKWDGTKKFSARKRGGGGEAGSEKWLSAGKLRGRGRREVARGSKRLRCWPVGDVYLSKQTCTIALEKVRKQNGGDYVRKCYPNTVEIADKTLRADSTRWRSNKVGADDHIPTVNHFVWGFMLQYYMELERELF